MLRRRSVHIDWRPWWRATDLLRWGSRLDSPPPADLPGGPAAWWAAVEESPVWAARRYTGDGPEAGTAFADVADGAADDEGSDDDDDEGGGGGGAAAPPPAQRRRMPPEDSEDGFAFESQW